jgi:aflatoxin B1 aldehyde reductase
VKYLASSETFPGNTEANLSPRNSSVDQLDQNLKDIEAGPLPEEVVQALDKAWNISKVDQPNYWHLDLKYTYDTRKALFGA